ncbi:MAG: glucose-6-phosphate isomerase family protein [Erysipelotrichaceae bacterium]
MQILEAFAMMNFLDPNDNIISGEGVIHSTKLFKDIKQLYDDPDHSLDDQVVYDVYSYTKGDIYPGNLNWGMTIMHPIYSNGQCNFTRGHYHLDRDCVEFYIGKSGEGLLLLMNEAGKCWAEKVVPGSIHHIDGKLAHRLINTGDSDFAVIACWPSNAGHDYDAVDKQPFGVRVYKNNNEIVFKGELENE